MVPFLYSRTSSKSSHSLIIVLVRILWGNRTYRMNIHTYNTYTHANTPLLDVLGWLRMWSWPFYNGCLTLGPTVAQVHTDGCVSCQSGPEGLEDLCRAAGLQLSAGLHWHPLKLMLTPVRGAAATGEVNLLWRVKASRQEATFLSSMSFYLGCL